MGKNSISRKEFLKRISIAGAVGLGSGSFLAACGTGPKHSNSSDACTDLSGLTDAQKSTRSSLQYTGNSPYPNKQCNNCQHFTPPAAGSSCGTCSIVPGPINPNGHCSSWAAIKP